MALPARHISADGNAKPLIGCIEYGNLGERNVAQFLGDARDELATGSAGETECRAGAKSALLSEQSPEVELPPEPWSESVQAYFPSDLSRSHETLLKLDGTIQIVGKPNEGYSTVFSYSVQPYEGRPDGKPSDLRVRLYFPEFNKNLLAEFYNINKTVIYTLEAKNEITYFIPSFSNKWIIVSAFLEFIDQNDKIVATIRIPAFTPLER